MISGISAGFGPRVRSKSMSAVQSLGPGAPKVSTSQRSIFTSVPRLDFLKDFLFGARGPGAGGTEPEVFNQVRTPPMALAERMSADFALLQFDSAKGLPDTKKAHAEYERAYHQLEESSGWRRSLEGTERAVEALRFIPGRRATYIGPRKTYVNFSRAITDTVQQRKGTVAFTFSNFCVHQHFLNAMKVEMEQGMDLSAYLEGATLSMLSGREAPPIDSKHGATGEPKARPSITSVELADFREGGGKAVPVVYFSASGKPLDTKEVIALYDDARILSRSDANKACFKKTGKFLPEATAAIEKLQLLVHEKFSVPLPTSQQLVSDPSIGMKPELWK